MEERFDIFNVNGHYEIQRNGKFYCSADTVSEAADEVEKAIINMHNTKPFCPECYEYVTPISKQQEETYSYKGKQVTINANILLCPKCNTELFDIENEDNNLKQIYQTR